MRRASDDFYKNLVPFSDFSRIGEAVWYSPVPDDWTVLVADIVRSGRAISDGGYKQVNLIGAAVIAAVLNISDRETVPYVFGGDGATLLVPPALLAPGREALAGVAAIAQGGPGLKLRIAAIPVADLRAKGTDVRVGKFQMSPGNHLAMFTGDGLQLAEWTLKDPQASGPYNIPVSLPSVPDLQGLSCRWQPLMAQNGVVVSVIIKPSEVDKQNPVSDIIKDLNRIVGLDQPGASEDVSPAKYENLRFSPVPSGVWDEVGLVNGPKNKLKSLARALFESICTVFAKATGRTIGPLVPDRYLAELLTNTDFRKLEDSLRLVLDLSRDQAGALRQYLADGYAEGRLVYGMHEADSALLTCFVTDIGASQHVHFVDGAGGGLSLAAQDYKTRHDEREFWEAS